MLAIGTRLDAATLLRMDGIISPMQPLGASVCMVYERRYLHYYIYLYTKYYMYLYSNSNTAHIRMPGVGRARSLSHTLTLSLS